MYFNFYSCFADNLVNNNKAIALPVIPLIAEGVRDTLIATGTALGASTLLKHVPQRTLLSLQSSCWSSI